LKFYWFRSVFHDDCNTYSPSKHTTQST
jgi:hypothetical protein